MRFALALHTDDGIKYGVTVPNLPGCFSAGDTFDEAIEMAREAIAAHCELLAEKGLDIPAPRPHSEHQANPDLAGAVWVVLEVDVESDGRPVARLLSSEAAPANRVPGSAKGLFIVPDDFDAPLEDFREHM